MSDIFGLTISILGSFTSPLEIGVTVTSMLWLLPLIAAIVIGYKTNKLHRIETLHFLKESALLFLSIILFMTVTGVVLSIVAGLIVG